MRLWLLADQQGTIRDIVNDDGVLRKHIEYDSFGRVTDEIYQRRRRRGRAGLHTTRDRPALLLPRPAARRSERPPAARRPLVQPVDGPLAERKPDLSLSLKCIN